MPTTMQWAQGLHQRVPSIPVDVFYAWIMSESGDTVKGNNPLNVSPDGTLASFGTSQQGLEATVSTINQPNMSGILQAARDSGNNAYAIISAIGNAPWAESKYMVGECTTPGCNIAKVYDQTHQSVNKTQSSSIQWPWDVAGNLLGQAGNTIGDKFGQAGNTIGDKAGQAGNTIGDKAGQAGNAITSPFDWIQSTAWRMFFMLIGIVVCIVAVMLLMGAEPKDINVSNMGKTGEASLAEDAALGA